MRLIQHNILAASIIFCPAFIMVSSAQEVASASLVSMSSEVSIPEKSAENQLEDFITASANNTATNIADCNLALQRGSANEIKVFSMRVSKNTGLMSRSNAGFKKPIIIPFVLS